MADANQAVRRFSVFILSASIAVYRVLCIGCCVSRPAWLLCPAGKPLRQQVHFPQRSTTGDVKRFLLRAGECQTLTVHAAARHADGTEMLPLRTEDLNTG